MSRDSDFFDLVGDEGSPEELERLRRAHDMLLAAGPPPELSPRLAEAPGTRNRSSWMPRRRRGTAFLLAAGVAAAAFGIGFYAGDRGSSDFSASRESIHMHAVQSSSLASASLQLGHPDEVGNWPVLLHVSGLKKLPKGVWYELFLTEDGKIKAWCGAFSVAKDGRTTVRMSVPYKLEDGVGWVITTSKRTAKPQVLLTT
jgi:hypothetical protein